LVLTAAGVFCEIQSALNLEVDREVVLFDNAGISGSSGDVPTTIEEMAANTAAFIKALGLAQVDVLGFSLGGLVAQEVAIAEPKLVRRLVLVGTGPRGGKGMASLTPEAQRIFGATYENPDDLWLGVFFTSSERSQAAGREYLKRFRLRTEGRDPEVNGKVGPAQIEALSKWGAPRENAYAYLKALRQPTLVVNGGSDVIIYTVNSFILQQHIPKRGADPLSRRQSRLALPVSRAVCSSRLDVPDGARPGGGSRGPTIKKLAGKTALVTGASRGMGRASALALAAEGAQVLVHYGRGAKEAEAVIATIREGGGNADGVTADLALPDGPHKLARQARAVIGDRLDILVANAGVSKAATIEDTTVEDFDRLFAVNLRAPFFLIQQLLPILSSGDTGASVVLLSSLAAHAAVGTLAAYAATKGGIDTLVKHLAAALGARGIRVNAVAPGVVATDMSSFTKTDAGRDFTLGIQAMKRLAQPDDIGGVVTFLASDDARWISGDIIRVDGGSKL
jgi:NAD(P)-dependent dehydrogenase (short-subunit alcohol dehydrogenase family)/pimeloyl-ACP methyl ester carboxylesterase